MTTIKTISKTAAALVAFSLILVSCKKESDTAAPLNAQHAKASVSAITTVVNGNFANPASGPAAFGTVYFNLATGAQDATGSIDYHVLFTGTNNATISPDAGYTLKYLSTTKALSLISASDYAAATPAATLGRNTSTTATPNGWWDYNSTTHVVTATPNIVLFLFDGVTTYAFKCTNAAGEGTATSNRGVYTFQHGAVL